MLALDDPLWAKLGTAYDVTDIPRRLVALRMSEDVADAADLCFEQLHHQETLYPATYAAVPHLISMAEEAADPAFRRELAMFLGWVALLADPGGGYGAHFGLPPPRGRLRGLATDPAGWSASEKHKLGAIEAEYLALPPRIDALCRRAIPEADGDCDAIRYLLIGPMAISGKAALARALEAGENGGFPCPHCALGVEWQITGGRIGFYARPALDLPADLPRADLRDPPMTEADGIEAMRKALEAIEKAAADGTPHISGPDARQSDPMLEDWRSGTLARAATVLEPAQTLREPLMAIAELATASGCREVAQAIRLLLASGPCPHCRKPVSPTGA